METIQEELPDVFGPYFKGLQTIHTPLFTVLTGIAGVNAHTEMHLLQCSFREYLAYGHDAQYEWKRFCFNYDQKRDFAFGFNTARFKHKEKEIALLSEALINTWRGNGRPQVSCCNDILSVDALQRDDNEMVVSMHFWFDARYATDAIKDTQYCKLVYTYTSLVGLFDAIVIAGVQ